MAGAKSKCMARTRVLCTCRGGVTVEGWFGEKVVIEQIKCNLGLEGRVGL